MKVKSNATLLVDTNKKKVKNVFIARHIQALRIFEEETKSFSSFQVEENANFLLVYYLINQATMLVAFASKNC